MKIKLIALLTFLAFSGITGFGQEKIKKIDNTEFTVQGVCKMCKKRIEKAALIKGVKLAEWDKSTKQLKVTYSPKKVSVKQVEKAVAAVGHDTERIKADDEVYAKLPDCCLYRDGVKDH